MVRRRRRSAKAGLPPGTLVYTGRHEPSEVRITVIDYTADRLEEKEVGSVEECYPFMDRESVTWINVDGVSDTEVIRKLGEHFGMHPLVMEDLVSTDQRPKVEDYQSFAYIVARMLRWDEKAEKLVDEQVSFVLGKGFVISFQEEVEGDAFEPVRQRIRASKSLVRKLGSDYLLYSLLDAVVDEYFGVLEKVGDRIETVDEELMERPTSAALKRLHRMKRELIFLRRAIWPLREVVGNLTRGFSPLIGPESATYLRDVHDHTIQVADTIETYRDMLASALDLYLSVTSNRMNEVMKVLTIIGTIFLPITFIAGVYGMNFEVNVVPGFKDPWGFEVSMLIMLLVSLGLLYYFRRRKWI